MNVCQQVARARDGGTGSCSPTHHDAARIGVESAPNLTAFGFAGMRTQRVSLTKSSVKGERDHNI